MVYILFAAYMSQIYISYFFFNLTFLNLIASQSGGVLSQILEPYSAPDYIGQIHWGIYSSSGNLKMFSHLNSCVQAQDMLGFAILAATTITPISVSAQMLNVGNYYWQVMLAAHTNE